MSVQAVVTRPEQIVRPIDSYLPGEQQLVSLTLACYSAINDCLQSQGVAGTATPFSNPGDLATNIHIDVTERKMLTTLYGDFDPDGDALAKWQQQVDDILAGRITLHV